MRTPRSRRSVEVSSIGCRRSGCVVVVVVVFAGLKSMPGNYDAFWTKVPGIGRRHGWMALRGAQTPLVDPGFVQFPRCRFPFLARWEVQSFLVGVVEVCVPVCRGTMRTGWGRREKHQRWGEGGEGAAIGMPAVDQGGVKRERVLFCSSGQGGQGRG
ncbi:hypothetical protein F5X68DRAFT_28370 [Plectosphaerella plurivora]|uniref:Uncharacterized protein n=1 Tax=Plectosphaerella plurivora TaxID=936078 RepID=A0A9P8VL93_9PEZI|nr:hypothetical protein F5X68DRAFT_28370 [Plectosphaerella plurivora]